MNTGDCFGFYTGEWKCTDGCKSMQQCKAIVNSDGLDVASDVLEQLIAELPDKSYVSTPFHRVVLQQVLNPNNVLADNRRASIEAALLSELNLAEDQ